jgi:nucleoside-diphosphate-sugar epimerase
MEALLRHLIVTGASGFLGGELITQARRLCPAVRITPLLSPRLGGIDLSDRNCAARLSAAFALDDPANTALIHAAAVIQVMADPLANETMATGLAHWAQSAGIGFSVMVSSVSVYTPRSTCTPVDGSTEPVTPYGRDKLNSEKVWQRTLPPEKMAIVRLAGVWGWQRRPTLFWNRLLLAAARGSPPEPVAVVLRKRSRRNYVSASEAAESLIQLVMHRMAGTFLLAGRNPMNMASFVDSVQQLPGSRLQVEWRDDGGSDECLYDFSPEIAPWLQSFEDTLSTTWAAQPRWLLE